MAFAQCDLLHDALLIRGNRHEALPGGRGRFGQDASACFRLSPSVSAQFREISPIGEASAGCAGHTVSVCAMWRGPAAFARRGLMEQGRHEADEGEENAMTKNRLLVSGAMVLALSALVGSGESADAAGAGGPGRFGHPHCPPGCVEEDRSGPGGDPGPDTDAGRHLRAKSERQEPGSGAARCRFGHNRITSDCYQPPEGCSGGGGSGSFGDGFEYVSKHDRTTSECVAHKRRRDRP